ncbi:MAG TPA: hypothetical protein VM120_21765 [Bryobacteraceae bacterium]|nr:hypothetical protein [Bryobacteraceae bacterium]
MQESLKAQPVVDPPRGFWPAKVDDKGRLKVPTNFITYLTALQANKLFITSLDETTAKVYTIPTWTENVRILQHASGDNRQWAKDVLFQADYLGADAELDSGGRLLLPTELRRLLGFENSQVYLQAQDGLINIFNQQVFEEKRKKAKENLQTKVEYVEGLGVK